MVIKMSILMILISSMVMNMVEVEVDQIESWVKCNHINGPLMGQKVSYLTKAQIREEIDD